MPVQRPPGLSGESETLVVGVCSFPDGFTRWLVLGMHCAASQPTSKPGRPRKISVAGIRWGCWSV